MTTSHKIVLSLVAAICITLIVFYSVQGNAQYNSAQRQGAPTAMATTPAATSAKSTLDAATPPAAKTVQTPVIVGRTDNPRGSGIDDLVAKVRTEIATSETPGADAAVATPVATTEPLASANVPAATPIVTHPAPEKTSEVTTATAPPAATTPAAPSANAVAQVPSFTLGQPAATLPSPGGATTAKDDRTKMPYDVNLRDLADMPVVDEPLPPLVRVRPNDEASAKSEVKTETKPTATGETVAKSDSPAATTTPPLVIVVDPHKPAVKVEEPAVKPAESKVAEKTAESKTKDVELALKDVKPGANTSAKAPPVATVKPPVPATAAPTGKTYTIKAGDSFSSIATAVFGAEKHWIDIADANPGIDPKKVRVGQVINLPEIDKDEKPAVVPAVTPGTPAVKPEPAKPAAPAADDAKLHEVKAGENLSNISRRYFNTPDHWRHIYLTNRELIGGDPSKLQAGTKLKITTPPKN